MNLHATEALIVKRLQNGIINWFNIFLAMPTGVAFSCQCQLVRHFPVNANWWGIFLSIPTGEAFSCQCQLVRHFPVNANWWGILLSIPTDEAFYCQCQLVSQFVNRTQLLKDFLCQFKIFLFTILLMNCSVC